LLLLLLLLLQSVQDENHLSLLFLSSSSPFCFISLLPFGSCSSSASF